ncbi:MAG: hypothetical protein IJY87_00065 [Bacilli bacterium]|nr:hypothetical protein [Bacilli bacterium]
MEKKKIIIGSVIGIITLMTLVIGAAYAYFSVTLTNNYESKKITAELEEMGTVVLSAGNDIELKLTALQMMQQEEDVIYYASSNGATEEETNERIGTASVVGNGTYSCNYTITVSSSGTNDMYEAFQGMSTKSEGQMVLSVNGIDYDFNTENLFPLEIKGTLNQLNEYNEKYIEAKLKFVNKSDVDQSALAGTDIELTFKIDEFKCEAAEATASGTWEFNETPEVLSEIQTSGEERITYGVDFTSNNEEYDTILVEYNEEESISTMSYVGEESVVVAEYESGTTIWSNAAYKKINLGGEQAITNNVNTLLNENAVVTEEVEQENSLAGTWVFNDSIDTNVSLDVSITFTSTHDDGITTRFIGMYIDKGFMGNSLFYRDSNQERWLAYDISAYDGGWRDNDGCVFKQIDFGIENQVVSEDFFDWFTANATKQ